MSRGSDLQGRRVLVLEADIVADAPAVAAERPALVSADEFSQVDALVAGVINGLDRIENGGVHGIVMAGARHFVAALVRLLEDMDGYARQRAERAIVPRTAQRGQARGGGRPMEASGRGVRRWQADAQ